MLQISLYKIHYTRYLCMYACVFIRLKYSGSYNCLDILSVRNFYHRKNIKIKKCIIEKYGYNQGRT